MGIGGMKLLRGPRAALKAMSCCLNLPNASQQSDKTAVESLVRPDLPHLLWPRFRPLARDGIGVCLMTLDF